MRKILLMSLMLFSIGSSFARTNWDMESVTKDVLLKEEGSKDYPSERPRTLVPFTCVYADGMVQLALLGEVGEFTLTVTNQLTGEQWSADNALILQTSTASGTYWVQIETEDGSAYYGTYSV